MNDEDQMKASDYDDTPALEVRMSAKGSAGESGRREAQNLRL